MGVVCDCEIWIQISHTALCFIAFVAFVLIPRWKAENDKPTTVLKQLNIFTSVFFDEGLGVSMGGSAYGMFFNSGSSMVPYMKTAVSIYA